mgnify:CR=1 FL=1
MKKIVIIIVLSVLLVISSATLIYIYNQNKNIKNDIDNIKNNAFEYFESVMGQK